MQKQKNKEGKIQQLTNQFVYGSSTQKIENKKEFQFSRIQIVNISYPTENQLQQSIKMINEISQIKAEKIKLILNTKFDDEQEQFHFIQALSQIAHKIHYLKWRLSGKCCFNKQEKWFGETLELFTQLYSLDLQIVSLGFNNRVASLFADGLSKLQNLRILKLHIPTVFGSPTDILTEIGINNISVAIQQYLKNLEYIWFDKHNWQYFQIPQKVSNYIYQVDYSNEYYQKYYIWDFLKKIKLMKNKLTELHIQNYKSYGYTDGKAGSLNCCSLGRTYIYTGDYSELVVKAIKECIHYPYLTHFSELYEENDIILQDYDYLKRPYSLIKNEEFNYHKALIVDITKTALKNITFEYLPINPNKLVLDFYFN